MHKSEALKSEGRSLVECQNLISRTLICESKQTELTFIFRISLKSYLAYNTLLIAKRIIILKIIKIGKLYYTKKLLLAFN